MASYFNNIIGNDHAKQYLTRMVEKKAIANSLLFAGPDGVGKSLFAEAFAKLLMCEDDVTGIHAHKIDAGIHPDVRIYRPEGKIGMHSIDSLRNLGEEVALTPYEGKWKIFIIHDADRMLVYSANALLKTFEEPGPNSIIILLSSAPESLIPTVLSRCRTIRFHTIPENDIIRIAVEKWGKNEQEAQAIAVLSRGSIGNAFKLAAEGGDHIRDLILKVLAEGKMTSYTQIIEKAKEIGDQIEESKQKIEETLRATLTKGYPEDLTSVQQQVIEKEVEGAIAMRLAEEAQSIFDIILSWYRDMHLLQVNGNHAYLLHRDKVEESEQSLQRGEILSLEAVEKAVSQAKLALERSTPLNNCLENLFLKLDLL